MPADSADAAHPTHRSRPRLWIAIVWALLLVPLHPSLATQQLRVHCVGDGTPVYLIGGGPAFTTWHLDPIAQQFKDRYRVCRWDMRGVGDNATLPLAADNSVLQQWLDDMAAVLPERPAVLWGHSWGALQALLFARAHPQRVAALVLSNPVDPALESLVHIETKRHVHDIPGARLGLDDIGTPAEQRLGFRSKIASYFVDGDLGWAYSAQFSAADSNNVLNVQIWDEYRQIPLTETDILALAPKVLSVIQCQHDVLMPETAREYARLSPTTPQAMLDDCAHFPWVETPKAYYEALGVSLSRMTHGYTVGDTSRAKAP